MTDSKQLHIRLDSPDQVADYVAVRTALGIRRDADLIRYLLRKEARALHGNSYSPHRHTPEEAHDTL